MEEELKEKIKGLAKKIDEALEKSKEGKTVREEEEDKKLFLSELEELVEKANNVENSKDRIAFLNEIQAMFEAAVQTEKDYAYRNSKYEQYNGNKWEESSHIGKLRRHKEAWEGLMERANEPSIKIKGSSEQVSYANDYQKTLDSCEWYHCPYYNAGNLIKILGENLPSNLS